MPIKPLYPLISGPVSDWVQPLIHIKALFAYKEIPVIAEKVDYGDLSRATR